MPKVRIEDTNRDKTQMFCKDFYQMHERKLLFHQYCNKFSWFY